ncbi:choice-of-anchor B family protein [Bacteroidota bacterium]
MSRFSRTWIVALFLTGSVGALKAQEIASQSGFGTTVSISGGDLLISEPMNERIPGAVYVFGNDTTGSWVKLQTLSADDGHPGDRFGLAVDVDHSRMVVGASRSDDERGAVYLYERDSDGAWYQRAKIQPDSLVPGDHFGTGLALDGRTLYASIAPYESAGSVFVFEEDDKGLWRQTGRIDQDPEIDGRMFGAVLETAYGALIVSSPSTGNGQVHIYRLDPGNGGWKVDQTLIGRPSTDDSNTGPGGAQGYYRARGDLFGAKLFTEGAYLFVTAPNFDEGTGQVYSYRTDEDGRFRSSIRLQPFDSQRRHFFGQDVAYTGSQILVSSTGADNFRGAVYVMEFDSSASSYTSAYKVAPDGPDQASFFGSAMAANDSVVVVGAPRDSRGYGAAYVLERDHTGNWALAAKVGSEFEFNSKSLTGDMVQCEEGLAANFGCKNVDLVSYITNKDLGAPHGVLTNDVWGWTDPDTGKEYALVGRNDGTTFIDISNPSYPVVLGVLTRTEGSPISIWRDIKVYKNHAFIVADGAGAHGMQIFDLTELRNVTEPPAIFEETAHYGGIYSAHNIVINEETGFAYTVGNNLGGEVCAGGSHMINIQDPINPSFAGCFAHTGTGRRGTGYTHDAQCVVYSGPDERFTGKEICFAANETAISIADVTDKAQPVAIAKGTYPNPGYTHQGWLSEDHRYFFVNDELDEITGGTDGTRTLIWDIAELTDPVLINEYVSDNRATDHNLYVRGHYLYQSNYVSGLRIVDISNVESPVEVGYFDTVNWGEDKPGMGGSWSNYPFFKSGIIVVTSGEEGVFFLKRSDVDI